MTHAAGTELRDISKIETHLHLEGSLTEQQLVALASKHQSPLLGKGPDAAVQLYNFETFTDFLNAYKVCCEHLKTPEDYRQLTAELLQRLADQHCVYAEILFTPSICPRFGLPAREVIEAVLETGREGQRRGIQVRWIFDTVRQWGADPCWQTLEWALQYRDRGVVGLCIGGDEASQPARVFRDVFESAEKAGLHRSAHAGEICDARSVWHAIEELRAERIGHGVHALQDPLLVDYLIRHSLPLEISITSNFRTGAVDKDCVHPILEINRRGIPFTLNSDDPGLFRTSLQREWELAAGILGWFPEQFVELVRRTLRHTFLTEDEREQIRAILGDG